MALDRGDKKIMPKNDRGENNVIKDIAKVTKRMFAHVKIVIPPELKEARAERIQQMMELTKNVLFEAKVLRNRDKDKLTTNQ